MYIANNAVDYYFFINLYTFFLSMNWYTVTACPPEVLYSNPIFSLHQQAQFSQTVEKNKIAASFFTTEYKLNYF